MILYADLPFSERTWVSRNCLRYPNGGKFFINAPVAGGGARMIRDVELHPLEDWRAGFFKKLRTNYGAAPFYLETADLLDRAFSGGSQTLFSLNASAIREIARHLEIPTEIEARPFAYTAIEESVRDLPKEERMMRRIVEICRENRSGTYVNAIGGRRLYARELFLGEGIDIRFIASGACSYDQRSRDFIPDLSIIDLLMHCGKNGARALLTGYELI
jgi:hypothetical protein